MLKLSLTGFMLAVMAASMISTGHAAEAGHVPQVSNEQGVKVTVTPINLSPKDAVWNFEVVLETHKRNLGEDMARSSALVIDAKRHAPIAWDGAQPGGHHRKGLLRFRAIKPAPASMELQIRLKGEVAPRSFRWGPKGAGHGN